MKTCIDAGQEQIRKYGNISKPDNTNVRKKVPLSGDLQTRAGNYFTSLIEPYYQSVN